MNQNIKGHGRVFREKIPLIGNKKLTPVKILCIQKNKIRIKGKKILLQGNKFINFSSEIVFFEITVIHLNFICSYNDL